MHAADSYDRGNCEQVFDDGRSAIHNILQRARRFPVVVSFFFFLFFCFFTTVGGRRHKSRIAPEPPRHAVNARRPAGHAATAAE